MKTAVAVADRKALRFPLWHTAALLGLLATLIELSTRMHGASHSEVSHRLTGYLVVATFEWAMAAWIIFGCRIQGESVHSLLGDSTARLRAILRDCGLAIGFLVPSPLHAPGRHLQRKTSQPGEQSGLLPLARFPAQQPQQRHETRGDRVHPPIPAPRAALRFREDSPLWASCQPEAPPSAGLVPRSSPRHCCRSQFAT